MNELTTQSIQLPDNVEDLAKFTLIGREKLNAVRAEIRAIERVGLAKEVHEQKLQEAQEIAEAVLDAEAKIGELTSRMEKAQGQRRDLELNRTNATKLEKLKEIGINKDQASRFETLARHPQAIERAKATAKAEGRIVTRQDVFHDISATEYPTRRQKEAQELREAKKRAEDFENSKVVSIGEAKQNSDDKKLVFKEFMNEVQKANEALRHVSYRLDLEIDQAVSFAAIKAADKVKQIELQNELNHGLRTILHIQKVIEEAINEKQSK